MFSTTLKSILLFAVVYSQIFGGFSCCCLGRSLLADLNGGSIAATPLPKVVEVDLPERTKCPKCATRSTVHRAKPAASKLGTQTAKVFEDGQCKCQKSVVNARVSKEPVSESAQVNRLGGYVSTSWTDSVDRSTSCLGTIQLPAHLDGPSWQSVACVWKN
jgi:hypothetical protein